MLSIFLMILSAWLIAEISTGIFHWWEDRYGNEKWPIIGKHIIQPNIQHHKTPSSFCKESYWIRNYQIIIPALIGSAICYYFGLHTLCLSFIIMSQMNEIHSWSHQRCSRPIRFLQKLGILQSPKQHWIHHQRPYDKYYCVMTNYLNPILAKIRFWTFLEMIVWVIFDIIPRTERTEF